MTLFSFVLLSLLSIVVLFLLVYLLFFGLKFLKIIKEINNKMTEISLATSRSELKNEAEHIELRKEIEVLALKVDRYDLFLKRAN